MKSIVRKIARYLFMFVAFSIFTGCTKYSVDCDLVVQPRVMVSAGSDIKTPAIMARVYAWYIGEKDALDQNWAPVSYADADAGIVYNRATGEERPYNLWGTQSKEDGYVHITVTSSPVLLVAVDPVNKLYAYRTFKYQAPLERVFIPVTFKPYQQTPYRENEWLVVSDKDKDTAPEK